MPSRFRDALSAGVGELLMVTNFDQCLWAYTQSEWHELEKKVALAPQFSEEVKAFQRVFISAACECPIDRQGRILIPPSLREYAGIIRDVTIVGMTKRFEIWARERWDLIFTTAEQHLGGMGEKLSGLGL